MAVYEWYHNYHRILVSPSTVTVEQEDWGTYLIEVGDGAGQTPPIGDFWLSWSCNCA